MRTQSAVSLRLSALLGLAALALGCRSVTVPSPLGERPLALAPETWDGVWVVGSQAFALRVTEAAEGRFELAHIETSAAGFSLVRTEGHLRTLGEDLFVSLREDDDSPDATPRFTFARARRDGEKIVAWLPDANAFAAAVRTGVLPGEAPDRGTIALGPLQAEHLAWLTGHVGRAAFAWEQPLILRRLRDD